MKLLIVGFNARPIAKSALNAGHEVGVIDYFGDLDLLKLTKNCFSVLRQQPNEKLHRLLHRKPAEYLYYLAEIMADEQGDFSGILLGSAFDRYPELIRKFNGIGPVVFANTAEKFSLARDKGKINDYAKKAGFEIPEIEATKDYNELIEIAKNKRFPLVTRGEGGGGGTGIKFWKHIEDLQKNLMKISDEERVFWIQEYIEGIDASASAICSGNKVRILSINRQLIGDKSLGAPSDFTYCGNMVPLNSVKENRKLHENITEITIKLFKTLDLVGSNGVDFVIKGEDFYFMEVNPRFQGSLECIQYTTGVNVVQLHLNSFNGEIKEQKPRYQRYSIKGILFSDFERDIVVKEYPKSKWIVDRTHINVILERTDPFCSVILPTKKISDGYKKVYQLASKIKRNYK